MLKENKKIIMIIAIILFCIGVGLYIVIGGQNQKAVMGSKDGKSEDEIREAMNEKADKDILVFSMESEVTFKVGSDKAEMNIENIANNNYDIHVEIRKDDDNQLIYKSGKVKPGYIIREDKLDKALEKGSHSCTATIIGSEDGKEKKKAYMSMMIIIED